jgi:DNA-binding response OmpR family regulator
MLKSRRATSKAVELGRSADFDLAILDVNLNGKMITPAAELIKARGVPLIFATGYGAAGVPEAFKGCPALQKPFEFKALEAAINSIRLSPSLQMPSHEDRDCKGGH